MRIIKFAILLLISFSFTALFGCAKHLDSSDSNLGTGYLLSPEDITSINNAFDDIPAEKFQIDESTLYYWTQSGSKFHIFKDCQSLSRTKEENISSGDLNDAYDAGKEVVCSFCLKKGNLTEEDFPNNTDRN